MNDIQKDGMEKDRTLRKEGGRLMKRRIRGRGLSVLSALVLALIVGGCGSAADGGVKETPVVSQTEETPEEETPEEETPEEETPEEDAAAGSKQTPPVVFEQELSAETGEAEETLTLPADMPSDFGFSSGAGGWGTSISLQSDGTFEGFYSDSDMGSIGDDYPGGTVYYCKFSGKLEVTEKLDEYSYSLKLVSMDKADEEEYIEEDILYVSSEPYGMESGKKYILYLPETPLEGLSEEFLLWWPGRFYSDGQERTVLGCYGLYNQQMGYGFFTDAE